MKLNLNQETVSYFLVSVIWWPLSGWIVGWFGNDDPNWASNMILAGRIVVEVLFVLCFIIVWIRYNNAIKKQLAAAIGPREQIFTGAGVPIAIDDYSPLFVKSGAIPQTDPMALIAARAMTNGTSAEVEGAKLVDEGKITQEELDKLNIQMSISKSK